MATNRTKQATVSEVVKAWPAERRAAMSKVRKTILERLPKGYEETAAWGMLTYSVPLSVLPDTYNGQPLGYVALGSQKNYMTLHLMPLYGDKTTEEWFRAEFKARGLKLDMGKACVRFKSIDDLPLDLVGAVVAKYPVDAWVRMYEQSRMRGPRPRATRGARGTRAAKAGGR
jgi:Domain of unknown function (DU1801)